MLTVPQVVDRLAERGLAVSAETVREWARSGRVPAIQLPSGRFRFKPGDVAKITTKRAAA